MQWWKRWAFCLAGWPRVCLAYEAFPSRSLVCALKDFRSSSRRHVCLRLSSSSFATVPGLGLPMALLHTEQLIRNGYNISL
uniref:Putative secreted peptide n=1 Tax=Anopheles braziliensis TaxID=58242 RepID=A0A2M3ZPI7_9DIPT